MTKTALRDGEQWPDPRKKEKPAQVSPREINGWPIDNDSTIRCGRCGEEIVGAGWGAFDVLERILRDHIQRCTERRPFAARAREGTR